MTCAEFAEFAMSERPAIDADQVADGSQGPGGRIARGFVRYRPTTPANEPAQGRIAAWVRPGAVAASAMSLGGCSAILDPAGPVGADEKALLIEALAVMLAIVVPTILATLGFALWFRASNRHAKRRPDFVYSGRIELVTWAIPALAVMFLGGLAWIGSHRLDPAAPLPSRGRPVEVQVVSLDWKWLFIYPEQGMASVNKLVIPAGVPVHFSLTSASVMNTFFIPRLGGMIYTMNGMATQLNLLADKPGVFYGQSAHFSGDGFSDMHFEADAVSPADFAAWARASKASGRALDRPAYAALARQSIAAQPEVFGAVAPGLFEAIVSGALPAAPGPAGAQPVAVSAKHSDETMGS